jgi:hypothetical protein
MGDIYAPGEPSGSSRDCAKIKVDQWRFNV